MNKMKNKHALAQAAIETIAMVCGQKLTEGNEYAHHRSELPGYIAIRLEITGDVKGYVLVRFNEDNAKKVASAMMMGMPIDTLDEMSLSALSELGNMILGGATVHLEEQGIHTDITTPTLINGTVNVQNTVSVPLSNDEMRIVLDIAI